MSDDLILDPERCALIIQDLQNDVIMEGGAFAETGAPAHARDQNVVANVVDLAAACRPQGVAVLYVWYIVEPGAPGLKVNAPLFEGIKAGGMVRGTWGGAPVAGLEPQEGDLIVEKMRMSAWEGTRLEALLTGLGRDTIIVTGAFTSMSIEHTARTGADKGYFMIVPEDACSSTSTDWHRASLDYAMRSVATVTTCAAVKRAIGA
jgi:gluconolactonase